MAQQYERLELIQTLKHLKNLQILDPSLEKDSKNSYKWHENISSNAPPLLDRFTMKFA